MAGGATFLPACLCSSLPSSLPQRWEHRPTSLPACPLSLPPSPPPHLSAGRYGLPPFPLPSRSGPLAVVLEVPARVKGASSGMPPHESFLIGFLRHLYCNTVNLHLHSRSCHSPHSRNDSIYLQGKHTNRVSPFQEREVALIVMSSYVAAWLRSEHKEHEGGLTAYADRSCKANTTHSLSPCIIKPFSESVSDYTEKYTYVAQRSRRGNGGYTGPSKTCSWVCLGRTSQQVARTSGQGNGEVRRAKVKRAEPCIIRVISDEEVARTHAHTHSCM